MYIELEWGGSKYVVTSFDIPLSSSQGPRGGNCIPDRSFSVSIEVAPDVKAKPLTKLLEFARDQHDTAKDKGKGKLVVYKGEKAKAIIQVVEFEYACITDISSHVMAGSEHFSFSLSIKPGVLKISDQEFRDEPWIDIVSKS